MRRDDPVRQDLVTLAYLFLLLASCLVAWVIVIGLPLAAVLVLLHLTGVIG